MTTAQGQELTAAHRRAQMRAAAESVALSAQVWGLISPEDIDVSVPGWLEALLPVVERGARRSALLAEQYLRAFRTAEIGSPGSPVVADELETARVVASLQVTGPVAFKRAIGAGMAPRVASRHALRQLSGAVMRHVQAGGRQTVDASVRADRHALGWARVTAANPCEWCAMLASRGPVYGSREVAEGAGLTRRVRGVRVDGEAYHDSCRCWAQPSYGNWTPTPETERWERIYTESSVPGDLRATLRNMRRALGRD